MIKNQLLISSVFSALLALSAGPTWAQEEAAPPEAVPAEEAAPAEAAPAEEAAAEAAPAEEAPAEEAAADEGGPTSLSSSYIGILGTYLFQDTNIIDEDGERNLGDDKGAGVQFMYGNHGGDGGLGFEITLFGDVIETGDNAGTDFYRPGGGVDLVYSFGDRQGFTPFVLIGGGGVYDDAFPDERDEFAGYGNAGLGFVTGDFGKGVHLRVEARYVYDTFEQDTEDVRVGAGLEIALWDKPEVVMAPAEPAQVVEVVKEVSTGLNDADGDGIVDEKDKCPDTPPNTRVDGDGCPLPQILRLRGVTFEFNKDRLRPDSKTVLEWATEIMKRYPDMNVEVAGHTDSVGSDEYNQGLSERRAEAVKTFLTEQGVDAGRMTTKGYGEKEPVETNDTEEGREENRRVELRILN